MNYYVLGFGLYFVIFSVLISPPKFEGLSIDDQMQYIYSNYGLILEGHSDVILSLVQYQDRIFTGGKDCTIRIWEESSGIQVGILYGHKSGVGHLLVHPGYPILISGSRDGMIMFWDLKKNVLVRSIRAHSEWISDLRIQLPNTLYSYGTDGFLNIWALDTLTQLRSIQVSQKFSFAFSLSSENQYVVGTSSKSNLTFWELDTEKKIENFWAHKNQIMYVEFCSSDSTPDSSVISLGTEDGAKIWKFPHGFQIGQLEDSAKMKFLKVFNRTVIGINRENFLLIWDLRTTNLVKKLSLGDGEESFNKFFMNEKQNFLWVCSNKIVYKLDLNSFELKSVTSNLPVLEKVEINNDQGVIIGKSEESKVFVWDLATGELLNKVATEEEAIELDSKYRGILDLFL